MILIDVGNTNIVFAVSANNLLKKIKLFLFANLNTTLGSLYFNSPSDPNLETLLKGLSARLHPGAWDIGRGGDIGV